VEFANDIIKPKTTPANLVKVLNGGNAKDRRIVEGRLLLEPPFFFRILASLFKLNNLKYNLIGFTNMKFT